MHTYASKNRFRNRGLVELAGRLEAADFYAETRALVPAMASERSLLFERHKELIRVLDGKSNCPSASFRVSSLTRVYRVRPVTSSHGPYGGVEQVEVEQKSPIPIYSQ